MGRRFSGKGVPMHGGQDDTWLAPCWLLIAISLERATTISEDNHWNPGHANGRKWEHEFKAGTTHQYHTTAPRPHLSTCRPRYETVKSTRSAGFQDYVRHVLLVGHCARALSLPHLFSACWKGFLQVSLFKRHHGVVVFSWPF
jgi:hypothetical protein